MLLIMLIILYVLFGGVVWRMRGGAFTTITDFNPGTDGDRVFTSIIFALPLTLIDPVFSSIVMLGIFIGLLISGWGPFQSPGIVSPGIPEESWLRWLPLELGLPIGSVSHDLVGLAEAGLLFVLPMFLGLICIGVHAWLLLAMSPVFAISYLIPRLITLPTIPEFVTGQEWGEIFVGIFLALILVLVLI